MSSCFVQRPRRSGSRHAEDRERSGDEEEDEDDSHRGEQMIADRAPGQVRPERDEDEHDHDVRDVCDEDTHVALVFRVHSEPEELHVRDDQAGEERAQVAAAPGRVDGKEAAGDHGHDRDRGRLAPDARAAARDGGGKHDSVDAAERRRDRQVDDEVDHRLREGGAPARDHAGEGEREHGPGRVVQSGLGDDRLRDLRPQPDPVEEGDEDGGIGRGQCGADQQAGRQRHAEERSRGRPGNERRDDHAGDDEERQADCHTLEDPRRELQAAVEKDEGDADREDQLGSERVERDVDRVEPGRADQRAGSQQHEHLRHARQIRDQLRHQADAEEDRNCLDDVLSGHRSRL